MAHLSDDEIERFLAGRLEAAALRSVVRHLLAGCGICSRNLAERTPDPLLQQAAELRRGLRDQTLATLLDREASWRTDERKLAVSLERLDEILLNQDAALHLQPFQALHGKSRVEALQRQSWELRYRDPRRMKAFAYAALKAAMDLQPEEHDPALLLDLQARAWAELANSYRITDDFDEAEAAIAKARTLLRRGSGDLWLLARVAELEATLRRDQRRLLEDGELLDKIYQLYLKLGDSHMAGQTLISKGINRQYSGRSRNAVLILQAGLKLIDPDRDPFVIAAGRQSLIFALVSCGEFRQAGELLLKSDLRQSFASTPLSLLRVRWTEGRIQAGLGNASRGTHALSSVHEQFLDSGQRSSAAMVAIDMLPILTKQGKYGEARRAARASYGVLRDLGIHREAAKAEPYLD
jgi:tetratricopeptide (TPR) repeat protein